MLRRRKLVALAGGFSLPRSGARRRDLVVYLCITFRARIVGLDTIDRGGELVRSQVDVLAHVTSSFGPAPLCGFGKNIQVTLH
jgi:hypothetical protein